jgi:hypothetical protein
MAGINTRDCILIAIFLSTVALPAWGAPVVVQSGLGGSILGYDVDPNGTQGILSEYVGHGDGTNDVAVETFDLRTGAIVKFIKQKSNTHDDYVVLGTASGGAGLVETEHSGDIFVDKRTYNTINPLTAGKFTGKWTPPLHSKKDIITSFSASTVSTDTAVMGFVNGGSSPTYLYTTNAVANTFGPVIKIRDTLLAFNNSPVMAFNGAANQAIVGSSKGCPDCGSELFSVDLTDGTTKHLATIGIGFINGIAVDEADGIVCTTSEIDFSVEFYNIATHHVLHETIQGATNQANSGTAVGYDPVAQLFFLGQPFSSTGPNSSVQIYDKDGNFLKSVNNLHLPTSPARIAVSPGLRMGFVQSSSNGSQLQTFTY